MSQKDDKIISDRLLNILVCPVCKVPVKIYSIKGGKSGLKCSDCGRIYPIKEGIPLMLEEEAFSEENF